MTTSVVIPVWNGRSYLQKNLGPVLRLEADEIILIDDASTDGSADFIARNYPQIKLLRHSVNCGFPVSVNDGFAAAAGDVVILINQDVKPSSALLKSVLPHFQNPSVFAVTFNEQERSWAKAEVKNGFLEFTNGPPDAAVHDSFWASGGSAAFRKSLWDKLGGFDPIFSPGYYEDLDLSWRARRAGYRILWDPNCRVHHVTETAFKKRYSPRKLRYTKERNYLLAHWKNLDSSQFRSHFITLLGRVLAHPGYVVPVVLAVFAFIRHGRRIKSSL